jgi:hypothetical protein
MRTEADINGTQRWNQIIYCGESSKLSLYSIRDYAEFDNRLQCDLSKLNQPTPVSRQYV